MGRLGLRRKEGERVVLVTGSGERIGIYVGDIYRGNTPSVKLGFDAPSSVAIFRGELEGEGVASGPSGEGKPVYSHLGELEPGALTKFRSRADLEETRRLAVDSERWSYGELLSHARDLATTDRERRQLEALSPTRPEDLRYAYIRLLLRKYSIGGGR